MVGDPDREHHRRADRRRAADRLARRRAVRDVEARRPAAAAAVPRRPGRVAQPLPARRLQPDAARARPDARADRADVAEGVRLRHRDLAVRAVRRAAQARARRQRARERVPAAGRADRRLPRRHVPEGQERLVLEHLPAAAGAADLRADAVRARRQLALPAVRRLHDELLRLQPEGRLPRRPARRRPVLVGLPALLRRRLPRPRARVLRGAGGARRDRRARDARAGGALHGGERRVVPAAELVREGLGAQADDALRRARLQPLLLVRRARAGASR